MNSISIGEARSGLAELINQVNYNKERTIIMRRGKKVAVIVPIEDLELLEAIEDQLDVQEALEAIREAKEEGTLSWEAVKEELGI